MGCTAGAAPVFAEKAPEETGVIITSDPVSPDETAGPDDNRINESKEKEVSHADASDSPDTHGEDAAADSGNAEHTPEIPEGSSRSDAAHGSSGSSSDVQGNSSGSSGADPGIQGDTFPEGTPENPDVELSPESTPSEGQSRSSSQGSADPDVSGSEKAPERAEGKYGRAFRKRGISRSPPRRPPRLQSRHRYRHLRHGKHRRRHPVVYAEERRLPQRPRPACGGTGCRGWQCIRRNAPRRLRALHRRTRS